MKTNNLQTLDDLPKPTPEELRDDDSGASDVSYDPAKDPTTNEGPKDHDVTADPDINEADLLAEGDVEVPPETSGVASVGANDDNEDIENLGVEPNTRGGQRLQSRIIFKPVRYRTNSRTDW